MTKTLSSVAATLAVLLTSVAPATAERYASFGTVNVALLGGESDADPLASTAVNGLKGRGDLTPVWLSSLIPTGPTDPHVTKLAGSR